MDYGLIGKTLKYSYSKIIHEHVANISYDLMPLNEDELDSFMKKKDFKGINVTIPYKKSVIKYLDEYDGLVDQIGAANVVVNKNGVLNGYNTDYYGFVDMLKYHHIDVNNKHVLILGSGASSKMVLIAMKRMHARSCVVVSRDPKTKNMMSYDQAHNYKDCQVILNTTPVGTYPHEDDDLLVNLNNYPNLESVVDLVYNPFRTKLLIEAKLKGCKVCSGLYMLVSQAIRSLELFLDTKYDEKVYHETYLYLLTKTANIVLIGMPSCGKTSAAINLNKKLNIPSFDSDEEIVKDEGKSINEIFEKKGEEYFRKIEADKIKELSSKVGQIIATGGGTIMNEESVKNLMKNGYIIFLNRDINQMKNNYKSASTRPLLRQSETALDEIYQKRFPYYQKYADYIIENNGSKEQTLQTILENF